MTSTISLRQFVANAKATSRHGGAYEPKMQDALARLARGEFGQEVEHESLYEVIAYLHNFSLRMPVPTYQGDVIIYETHLTQETETGGYMVTVRVSWAKGEPTTLEAWNYEGESFTRQDAELPGTDEGRAIRTLAGIRAV